MKEMNTFKTLIAVVITALLTGCATPKDYNYLQDLKDGQVVKLAMQKENRIRPQDQLSIVVKSGNPELNSLFNKSLNSSLEAGVPQTNQYMSGYIVDKNGNIDFPVLGNLHLQGMTQHEAEAYIIKQLEDTKQLHGAVVNVEFTNLTFNALGEFRNPGRHSFSKNGFTILDAIGSAGDLSVYAKRDSIMLIREENGEHKVYFVDLTSGERLYASPAFYIQQNDFIYAKANKTKARQSTSNGNQLFTASFWISLASVLTTLAVLVFK